MQIARLRVLEYASFLERRVVADVTVSNKISVTWKDHEAVFCSQPRTWNAIVGAWEVAV